MPFATRGGVRIYWKSDGAMDRPVLLLGHPLGVDHHVWEPVVPEFRRYFRVVRFDHRGHGASDAPAGEYTLDDLGRDALAVADAAGAGRFSYLGLSMGGMIGLWLGRNAADRLQRLVACNAGAKLPTQVWDERIAKVRAEGMAGIVESVLQRWFGEGFRRSGDPRLESVRSTLSGMDAAGYVGCSAALRDMDLRPDLAAIAVPTLVLTCSDDQSTPKALGEAIAAAVPGARRVELQAAHVPLYEATDAFLAAAVPFLLGG